MSYPSDAQLERYKLAGVAYYKHQRSDSLTDEEVRTTLDAFEELAPKLYSLGPVFVLAAVEAQRIAMAFRDYSEARIRRI